MLDQLIELTRNLYFTKYCKVDGIMHKFLRLFRSIEAGRVHWRKTQDG